MKRTSRLTNGYKWLTVTLLVLSLFLGCTLTTQAADSATSQYFAETGHTVSGKFLAYWKAHGGLAIFGYPLTDPTSEVDPTTGKIFLTQWFERNRFELHPELANTPYEVELGLLGSESVAGTKDTSSNFKPTQDAHYPGGIFYAATGHNLHGDFKTFFDTHGGLAIFGYPLSEQFTEVNPDDGKSYTVQYFERNRFELHPDLANTPYEVELGLLGKKLLSSRKTTMPTSYLEYSATLLKQANVSSCAVDNRGNLFVAQDDSEQVLKFSLTQNNKMVATWGSKGSGDGQFNWASAMATDAQGNVYLADTENQRIQKFDNNGKFLAKFGTSGTGNGQFSQPRGIAIDSSGNIYVTDQTAGNIQKFDPSGKFLLKWTGDFGKAPHGLYDEQGPKYIAINSRNQIYVSDDANQAIQKFDSNGNYLGKITLEAVPTGMTIDAKDSLYVESAQKLIYKYDNQDKLVSQATDLAAPVTGFDWFSGANCLTVDNQDNFFGLFPDPNLSTNALVRQFRLQTPQL